MDITIFTARNVRFHGKKALFEVWEHQTAEMAVLQTAFPPTLTPGYG